MNLLMATCPLCRIERDTGIFADENAVRDLGPALQVLVLCNGCREFQKVIVKEFYCAVQQAV